MMQHAVDVSDLLEAFVDDVKEEVVLLERKLRREEAPVKKELPVQKESNLPGFELLQSLEDSVQARDDASAKQRLAECKDRLCRLQEHEGYRKTFKNRLVKDVGGKLHRPGRFDAANPAGGGAGDHGDMAGVRCSLGGRCLWR